MGPTTNVLVTLKASTTLVIASVTTRTSNRKAGLPPWFRRSLRAALISVLSALSLGSLASAEPSAWWLAQDNHFQIYSHASGDSARSLLTRFEQLRTFWTEVSIPGLGGLLPDPGVPLRVIEFSSAREYEEFQTHRAADAYYVASDGGEYIVLPPSASFGVSAHE